MTIYSYKIPRDYGFAPNPFYGFCSLATCKPDIRRSAVVGDWVLGFGALSNGNKIAGKLIFAMKVDKKITFDEYWLSEEFQCKKPIINGSLKQNYGDNIYHKENGKWIQSDSHHSFEGGKVNLDNLNKDTSANAVLLSKHFWYFGKEAIDVPESLQSLIPSCRNYFRPNVNEENILNWLESLPENGFIGEPTKFSEEFERYDGKS
jgi:hypothetical protein